MPKILVSGANGFIGRPLCARLANNNEVVAAVRRPSGHKWAPGVTEFAVGNVDANTSWDTALSGCSAVVHLAARVHVLRDSALDPLAEFRVANIGGTLELARQATRYGVRRFIFMSSIGVNGNATRTPFREDDVPRPIEAYAVSKLEAENALWELVGETGMELVILRPPLVYGRQAPGNFGRLLNAVRHRFPLPLGAIHNRRTFIGIDNLVDLVATCLVHPRAANQVFLAGDVRPVSTTELLKLVAGAYGINPRLIPVPQWMLEGLARFVGKKDMLNRLCGDLEVDISKARELLGWIPPFSVEEGIFKVVELRVD